MYLDADLSRRTLMTDLSTKRFGGSFFTGLLLLALGILFLLQNFDFIVVDHAVQYWPLIVIAVALAKLFDAKDAATRASAIWWLFVGCWLLVSSIHFMGLSFGNSWPLLLIGWGASILLKNSHVHPNYKTVEEHHNGL
jgi:hypothetical protein